MTDSRFIALATNSNKEIASQKISLEPSASEPITDAQAKQFNLPKIPANTRIKNFGELKAILIESMGEEAGTKAYNSFIKSMQLTMLNQLKSSNERARKSVKQMFKYH